MSRSDIVEYYRRIKDAYMAPHRAGYHKRRFDKLLSLLPGRHAMKIFDFGCGSGELAALLVAHGHAVSGSDLSPDMLEQARERAPGCDFALGGVDDLPGGEWDVVVALNVLPYLSVEEEARFFSNAARMLRPDGAIVFSHTNMLIDLVTFNRYTVEFWRDQIIPYLTQDERERERFLDVFKDHLKRPDEPPTSAARKSERDILAKRRINPIVYPATLSRFGLRVEDTRFTHYYPMPPQYMEAHHPDLVLKFEDAFDGSDLSVLFASIILMRAVRI